VSVVVDAKRAHPERDDQDEPALTDRELNEFFQHDGRCLEGLAGGFAGADADDAATSLMVMRPSPLLPVRAAAAMAVTMESAERRFAGDEEHGFFVEAEVILRGLEGAAGPATAALAVGIEQGEAGKVRQRVQGVHDARRACAAE
jgi:hypothetical protein